MSSAGKLYIVSTPIGNLEDITLRALEVLKQVDLVAAEDTRRTKILLDRFQITTRLTSYHSFNEHHRTAALVRDIIDGKSVALVSDAGTPCVADPGYLLMRDAVAAGIEPIIIPGVSALTFAVSASGLPSDRFTFYGFLPVKSGRKQKLLEEIRDRGHTAVVFESPFRIAKTLLSIREFIGPECRLAVVREATKMHEEILRGTAAEVVEKTATRDWKGEFVLVISPAESTKKTANDEDDDL